MIAEMMLVWVVWVNVRLKTQEDVDRRRNQPAPSFRDLIAELTWRELLMAYPLICWLCYVVITWFSLLGSFGAAELLIYQWVRSTLRIRGLA